MRQLRFGVLCLPLLLWTVQLSAQTEEQNIWKAANDGDIKTLRAEIKNGADVNQPAPAVGATPLVFAIFSKDPKVVKFLIKAGADVNRPRQDGNRPLHVATFMGYDKVVAELIKGGADIFAGNANNEPPSNILALDWQTTEYVASMLSLTVDEQEVTSGRKAIKKLFEKETASRARTDPWIALTSGNERAMKRHIRKMKDLNAQQPEIGVTPLSLAALYGHTTIAEMLLKAGADPNATNVNQSTALNAAAVFGHADIVKLILDHGGDASLRDETGGSALDAASLDWMSTEAIAQLFSMPLDFDQVTTGKKAVVELLTTSNP